MSHLEDVAGERVVDFVAGFKAGNAAYKRNSSADISSGKRAYNRVSRKHGILWLYGFGAALDLQRGAYNTEPARFARKLGIAG